MFDKFRVFVWYRNPIEQDMKNFSRDFPVNGNIDPQKVLEEEAKALAQFNKVCHEREFLYLNRKYRLVTLTRQLNYLDNILINLINFWYIV